MWLMCVSLAEFPAEGSQRVAKHDQNRHGENWEQIDKDQKSQAWFAMLLADSLVQLGA